MLTVLVEEEDIATRKVDGVSSAQAGNWYRVSKRGSGADHGGNSRPAPTTMTLSGMMYGMLLMLRIKGREVVCRGEEKRSEMSRMQPEVDLV